MVRIGRNLHLYMRHRVHNVPDEVPQDLLLIERVLDRDIVGVAEGCLDLRWRKSLKRKMVPAKVFAVNDHRASFDSPQRGQFTADDRCADGPWLLVEPLEPVTGRYLLGLV